MYNSQHSSRLDLSEWVIHFVHERKLNDEAEFLYQYYKDPQIERYVNTCSTIVAFVMQRCNQ